MWELTEFDGNVASSCISTFDMPDNAHAGYVILMSLVSNGVAMFVLLDDGMLHVVCLHCSGWEYRGFPMLNLKVPPPCARYIRKRARRQLSLTF